MRETKYWTWHILAGIIILVLLGIHMITVHLDAILGWFNPAGGEAIDWNNVIARAKLVIYAVIYIALLLVGLYHGLYGFRIILFELGPKQGTQRFINILFLIIGICLFALGSWVTIKFHVMSKIA
jgi:succinate dehydrogenase/fumarate reductase cytochrome b subunit